MLKRNKFTELRLFPNAKEITENFGAFGGVKKILEHHKMEKYFGRKDVLCVAIADGVSPRFGCLAALSSQFNVVSLDPCMHKKWTNKKEEGDFFHGIPNLKCLNVRVEDVDWKQLLAELNRKINLLIVAAVHSHTTLSNNVESILRALDEHNGNHFCAGNTENVFLECKIPVFVCALECCFEQKLAQLTPTFEYYDYAVHSPKRLVKLWSCNVEFLQKIPPAVAVKFVCLVDGIKLFEELAGTSVWRQKMKKMAKKFVEKLDGRCELEIVVQCGEGDECVFKASYRDKISDLSRVIGMTPAKKMTNGLRVLINVVTKQSDSINHHN